jgi:hypothetical protein
MGNHDSYSDYLLRFERVDNLGAYSIPSETGLLIPSVDVEKVTSISRMRFSRSMLEESDPAHALFDSDSSEAC